MASERTDELYKILLSKGYPKELCRDCIQKYEYRLYCHPDARISLSNKQSAD